MADQEEVDALVDIYQRRRDCMISGIRSIPGITCQVPQGAFYVFPNIKALGRTSRDLAQFLLDKAGVAVLPGNDFGIYGEGYLRLCYATSIENIELAIDRIKAALAAG
jgi:aspartate/methionine/tyrosine aminotransferase